jgi:DNA-binding transcriptional LysR family regulator
MVCDSSRSEITDKDREEASVELRHIEYFVAVAEELSFTRAAQRLSIAQSPVSQQVKKLERELGVDLFERTTRSVQLTDAGRIFYQDCIALLAASRQAVESAQLAGRGQLGRLNLAFTGSATYELMPLLVSAYHQRFPNVKLEIRSEMLTPPQVDGLLDGSISVGLLRPPISRAGLVLEILRHEPLVVMLPVSHPLASKVRVELADLANEMFVSYPSSPPSSVYQAANIACQQAGFTPRVVQEVAETATLVALVAAGLGVALAPASVRHLRVNGATHRPLAGHAVTVPLAIAYREGPVSPLVRGYLETTRTVFRSQQSRAKQAAVMTDYKDVGSLPDSI